MNTSNVIQQKCEIIIRKTGNRILVEYESLLCFCLVLYVGLPVQGN